MAHKGVLLVALGMRYKGYCANLGRSFIVDPSKVSPILNSLVVLDIDYWPWVGTRSHLLLAFISSSRAPYSIKRWHNCPRCLFACSSLREGEEA